MSSQDLWFVSLLKENKLLQVHIMLSSIGKLNLYIKFKEKHMGTLSERRNGSHLKKSMKSFINYCPKTQKETIKDKFKREYISKKKSLLRNLSLEKTSLKSMTLLSLITRRTTRQHLEVVKTTRKTTLNIRRCCMSRNLTSSPKRSLRYSIMFIMLGRFTLICVRSKSQLSRNFKRSKIRTRNLKPDL